MSDYGSAADAMVSSALRISDWFGKSVQSGLFGMRLIGYEL